MRDYNTTVKQNMIGRGYSLVSLVPLKAAIGVAIDPKGEPAAVFSLDEAGGLYDAFFSDFRATKDEYGRRCLDNVEQGIRFSQSYQTHRIGFYHGWMIVQPYNSEDGEIGCYLPSDEWDGQIYPDLDYLHDYYTSEWDAGTLTEAVDFIDSYHLY